MWELDYTEGWRPKNWCFWTVMLEKSLEIPLDCKEIKLVSLRNLPWIFTGRTGAETEAPASAWMDHLMKNLNLGHLMQRTDTMENFWYWEGSKTGVTEDEMVGWRHWFNGHEFEQAPGDGEGQGSLACFSLRGNKEKRLSDWTTTNLFMLNEVWKTQESRFQFLKLACKTNGNRCKINQEKLMILLERLWEPV